MNSHLQTYPFQRAHHPINKISYENITSLQNVELRPSQHLKQLEVAMKYTWLSNTK